MSEIKPVGKVYGTAQGWQEVDWYCAVDDDADLYALPDTHRIVSVELLQQLEEFAITARDYYSDLNDNACPSYASSWEQGVDVCKELRAIIDKVQS